MDATPYIVEGSDPRKVVPAIVELLADGEWHTVPVSHLGHRRAEYIGSLVDRQLAPARKLASHWDDFEDAFFGKPGFEFRLRLEDRSAPDRYLARRLKFLPDPVLGGSALG